MTYPKHWLLSFIGEFHYTAAAPAQETWSCGIRCLSPEFDVNEDDILQDHAEAWMKILIEQGWISQQTWGTAVKLNEIGPDGKYADQGNTHELRLDEGANNPIGGGGSQTAEPQRTLAVSWTTGAKRGLAHRGRIYLPGFSTPVGSDFGISNAGTIAVAMKSLLDSIQATAVLEPAVVSGTRQGAARVITGIEIGNRVDTQRRRRRSLQEVYSTSLA